MWSKSITRHRSLALAPHITKEDGKCILADHALLVRMFYAETGCSQNSEIVATASNQTHNYAVRDFNRSTNIVLELDENSATLREDPYLGIRLAMTWRIDSSDNSQGDHPTNISGASDMPGHGPGLSLHELVEIRGFRLLLSVLDLRIENAVSSKARAIAAAIEIRVEHPTITAEDLIDQVRTRVKALEEGFCGRNEAVIR